MAWRRGVSNVLLVTSRGTPKFRYVFSCTCLTNDRPKNIRSPACDSTKSNNDLGVSTLMGENREGPLPTKAARDLGRVSLDSQGTPTDIYPLGPIRQSQP